jgi:hypothetical protein
VSAAAAAAVSAVLAGCSSPARALPSTCRLTN